MNFTITLIIVAATVITSLIAFSNQKVKDDFIFYPPAVSEHNQWYRFLSYGLIHADAFHLIFNMLALYSFGTVVETGMIYKDGVRDSGFLQIFGEQLGRLFYLLMYVLALIVSLLPTYAKHKHNYHYLGLGASGAVSAVIFAGILLEPRTGVNIFFIPVAIPGYIFGPLYLILSRYMEKRNADNINHSAHIWGALFGMAFVLIAAVLFSDYEVINGFIDKIKLGFAGK